MGVVPEGETMNTDQRVSLLLVGAIEQVSAQKRKLEREADTWENDGMVEILGRQVQHLQNAYDRMVEIAEALAEGRLAITPQKFAHTLGRLIQVGDPLTVDDLAALPVGSVLRDSSGEIMTKEADGVWSGSRGSSVSAPDAYVAFWAPRLVSVPTNTTTKEN